jgi:hypothetical protein
MPRPNFFIVGAPRCGTTAMYEFLRQHPDVYMPYRKEPVYFGSDLHKRPPLLDEAAYLSLFDGARGRRAVGEATVWYLYSERAPGEIKAFAPEARIIVMLREPVEVIASLHSHFLFTANETLGDLGEALAAEEDRREGRGIPPLAQRPEGLQYRACGRYASHLRRYLDTFGPERVHVIVYDDFVADPAGTYRSVLEFLGVNPAFQPDFEQINQNKRVRSRALQGLTHARWFVALTSRLPPRAFHAIRQGLKRLNARRQRRASLAPALRRQLQAELAPDVRELEELLGRDLAAWRSGAAA